MTYILKKIKGIAVMEGNPFKQLMEEDEQLYLHTHDNRARSNVWGTLGLFRLVGDLVNMFLPRIVDVFVLASRGRDDEGPGARMPLPPSLGPSPDPGKAAPGQPDEDPVR